jgi:hypothetical protein
MAVSEGEKHFQEGSAVPRTTPGYVFDGPQRPGCIIIRAELKCHESI